MPNMQSQFIQNLKFLTLQQFHLPNSLPAIRPGSTMARAPVFFAKKGNRAGFTKPSCQKRYPLRHAASFYLLLVSFCLQIAYRKVRNLQIGVNKLVGYVSINL